MMFSNKKTVNTLVKLCVDAGLKDVVVSPGSRNAPLLFSFDACTAIRTITVVDERSAAFFALGMAQQLGRPVGLVCTSGTAALNYAPAIAEAYYQHIPLVVITADRPEEWIDQADGQTIRQHHIYENYIGFSCTLPVEINTLADERMLIRKVSQAFHRCQNHLLPVHINVPLREPLYERQNEIQCDARLIVEALDTTPLSSNQKLLSEKWNAAEKIMILAGTQNPNFAGTLHTAPQQQNIIVLTETTSNLNGDINCIDRTLALIVEDEEADFAPDLLITLGGQVISKNIKSFLRKHPPKEHWHISPNDAPDTYQCLTQAIHCLPNDFFAVMAKNLPLQNSDYRQKWLQKKELARQKHNNFLQQAVWSDWRVFSILTQHIPAGTQLQLANSTPVRYAQLFDTYKDDILFFANRGTSGIDGSTSTAAGATFACEKPTLLITGDLSFFYDSNALWNNYLQPDFKIIVINNGGGGIFRYVSQASEEEMKHYFEVSHQLSCSHLAACFGLNYLCAENENELQEKMLVFFSTNNKAQILEIRTIGVDNGTILKAYFNCLKEK